MKLYSYFRSSAAWRVRIVLHLKGLDHELVPVHLLRDGGEQRKPDYTDLNPQAILPSLVEDGTVLTQSLAIMEYLEERHPEPCLLPGDAAQRARIRAVCQAIACEIHPLNNLRVLQYLEQDLGLDPQAKQTWYRHWVTLGFEALERLLAGPAGAFCFGTAPTLADACLVPQVFNARRFDIDLSPFPRIRAIDAACLALPAFAETAPERQPDAA